MAFFNLLHKSKDNFQSKNIKPILKEYNQMHLLRTLKKTESKNIMLALCIGYLLAYLGKKAHLCTESRITDTQWNLVSSKSQSFGLGQTNLADKFWGIWGIFSQTISTHFGTVSPLSMFSIISTKKNKPLYPRYLFGIGIWIWAAKN